MDPPHEDPSPGTTPLTCPGGLQDQTAEELWGVSGVTGHIAGIIPEIGIAEVPQQQGYAGVPRSRGAEGDPAPKPAVGLLRRVPARLRRRVPAQAVAEDGDGVVGASLVGAGEGDPA